VLAGRRGRLHGRRARCRGVAALPLFLFSAGLDLEAGDLLRGIPWRRAHRGGDGELRCTPAALSLLAGGNCPCGCASGCMILLEATCFCAWDISSFLLHISGLRRCRPGICWRWSSIVYISIHIPSSKLKA
jgi:hypothetical protein